MKKYILIMIAISGIYPFAWRSAGAEDFNISKHIFIEEELQKKDLKVNEKTELVLRLYSDWLDIKTVSVLEPECDLISSKFEKGKTKIIKKEGTTFAVLEFKKWIYSPVPGVFSVYPVTVKFDVAKRADGKSGKTLELLNDNESIYKEFIGSKDSRSVELKTNSVSVTVSSVAKRTAKTAIKEERKPPATMVGIKGEIDPASKLEPPLSAVSMVIFFIGSMLLFVGGAAVSRRYWVMTSNEPEAVRLRAISKARRFEKQAIALMAQGFYDKFYESVFSAVQIYAAERFAMQAGKITERDIDVLCENNKVSSELRDRLKKILELCYAAKFAQGELGRGGMEAVLGELGTLLTCE